MFIREYSFLKICMMPAKAMPSFTDNFAKIPINYVINK